MAFNPGAGGGSNSVATATDVALSSPTNSQVLAYNSAAGKWSNQTLAGGGGAPTTYALGRVRYNGGWGVSRPTGYAYIDWIKSSASDPDPAAGLMVAGDTISEWQ